MSGFLLDTNIISELVRPKAEPKVRAWVAATDENLLYLSVLTLGEIRKGISALQDASRRVALEAWLDSDLSLRFANRDHVGARRKRVETRFAVRVGIARARHCGFFQRNGDAGASNSAAGGVLNSDQQRALGILR